MNNHLKEVLAIMATALVLYFASKIFSFEEAVLAALACLIIKK